MRRESLIRTRVDQQTKDAAQGAARRIGLNESAWLRRVVEDALRVAASAPAAPPAPVLDECRPLQVGIRLPVADGRLLRARAVARGIPPATYAAICISAHLRAFPPLVSQELEALKSTVRELNAIGRNLNQLTRTANQGGSVSGLGRAELTAVLRACGRLRDHVTDLMDANLASWGTNND